MCQQFNSFHKIYKPSFLSIYYKYLLSIYWPFLYQVTKPSFFFLTHRTPESGWAPHPRAGSPPVAAPGPPWPPWLPRRARCPSAGSMPWWCLGSEGAPTYTASSEKIWWENLMKNSWRFFDRETDLGNQKRRIEVEHGPEKCGTIGTRIFGIGSFGIFPRYGACR